MTTLTLASKPVVIAIDYTSRDVFTLAADHAARRFSPTHDAWEKTAVEGDLGGSAVSEIHALSDGRRFAYVESDDSGDEGRIWWLTQVFTSLEEVEEAGLAPSVRAKIEALGVVGA